MGGMGTPTSHGGMGEMEEIVHCTPLTD